MTQSPGASRAWFGTVCAVGLLAAVAFDTSPSAAQQIPGAPRCGVFHDLSGTPGAPMPMLAMAGVGREILAANDCMRTGRAPTACEHYRRVLKALDGMDAALAADTRPSIKAKMQQASCTA